MKETKKGNSFEKSKSLLTQELINEIFQSLEQNIQIEPVYSVYETFNYQDEGEC